MLLNPNSVDLKSKRRYQDDKKEHQIIKYLFQNKTGTLTKGLPLALMDCVSQSRKTGPKSRTKHVEPSHNLISISPVTTMIPIRSYPADLIPLQVSRFPQTRGSTYNGAMFTRTKVCRRSVHPALMLSEYLPAITKLKLQSYHMWGTQIL